MYKWTDLAAPGNPQIIATACAVGRVVHCWCTCTGNLTNLGLGRDDKVGTLPEELRPSGDVPGIDEYYLFAGQYESVSVDRSGVIHFRTSSQSNNNMARRPRGSVSWVRQA